MRVYILSTVLVAAICSAQTLVRQTCSDTRSSVDVQMTGANAVIGGLFEMRTSILGGYACGEPHKELIQVYEAARWALQKVNTNAIVPGVKLGMKAYDTCSSEVLALKYAQDFYSRLTTGQYSCTTQSNQLYLGFLGPLSSWTTTAVAEMAGKLPASVLSPRAMSTALSDTAKYPYFLRTSPSSRAQAKAMIEVLKQMNWKRVMAVYTSSIYGNSGYETMVKQAMENDICITKALSVPSSGSVSQYAAQLTSLPKYDTDVALFFGSYNEAKTLFQALDTIGSTPGIRSIQWMVTDMNLMQETYSNIARGAIAVMPRATLVTQFRDYFINLNEVLAPTENPWLANWYMTQYQCKLPGVTYLPYSNYTNCITKTTNQRRNDFRQNAFVDRTIMAVFAYAKALRKAQEDRCGTSFSGICPSLQALTTSDFHKYLKDVDFTFSTSDNVPSLSGKRVAFDENGDFITEDFTIWNYNDKSTAFDFHEVGRYENGQLALSLTEIKMYDNNRNSLLTSLPTSPCPAEGCGRCVIPRNTVEFMYMPGDLVIAGVVRGHAAGNEPLSCGDVNELHMAFAVAFYYAVQTVKTKFPTLLNGVNLGGLIVDVCNSQQTGTMFFNNILAEIQVVRDKRGRIVDPNAIKIITSALTSTQTMLFTDAMKAFDIQELGISATASTLSDKMKYPNFARVIPSDAKQAIAMTQFFIKNGWSFIQTINSPGDYGRRAIKDLRQAAVEGHICIGASYETGTDGTIAEILNSIRQQSQARVVVLFIGGDDKKLLLQALKAISWSKDYVFVGTDGWYSQMFVGYEEYAPGFVSFQPQLYSLSSFETWLNSINPRQANDIPGFSEWYEELYNCYIVAENRGKYTNPCGSSSITAAAEYIPNAFIGNMINSVYLSAHALDKSLKSICGNNYNGVCSAFRSGESVSNSLKSIFNNISFVAEISSIFKVEGMEGMQDFDIFNYQGSGFIQIGKFSTEQGRLSDQFNLPVQLPPGLTSGTFKSVCEGRCAQCSYVYNPGEYAYIPGDVEIGGIFGIHDVSTSNPYVCGDLRTVNGFQFAAAMMYAVDQVNSKMSPVDLKNVKLGALILDHCNVESRRFDVLSSLYSGLLPVDEHDNITVSKVRAWVTDNTRSAIEVNEVVKPLNIPLISPLATSNSLTNKDDYPTFFRTIQGDVTLSVAMAKLAKALNFRYVTVLYSDEEYGKGGLETFTAVANQEGVCILSSHKIDSTTNMTQVIQSVVASTTHVVVIWTNGPHTTKFYQEKAKHSAAANIVVISPMPFMSIAQGLGTNGGKSFFLNIKTSVINKYMDFIRNLPLTSSITTNPFLMEYYMNILGCDLPNFYMHGVQCSNIQTVAAWSAAITQDNYVIPTINAVYSFTAALDATLKEKCGPAYTDVCNNFLTMDNVNNVIMEKMETTTFKDPSDFTFRFMNREGNTGMNLIYYDGSTLKTVGEFAGASLQISDNSLVNLFPGTQSRCNAPCTECVNTQMEFSYIPGDILIGGVFDVHNNDINTFSCGNIKTLHGFQLLEAFHYAISKVNDKEGPFANVLKNIKLGGVGLDSCESAIKTGYTVSDIHNGIISLTKNGETINPDDISAYIAGYSSDSSLYLARIAKSLKIPQISYASTSMALSNKDKYPYFMRSVPADDNQAESMIRFLDNFDIRYVQVVYSPNNYGRLGSMAFSNLARENKICIGQMIQFPDNGTATRESSNEVVSAILKKPTANTVVIFADTGYINTLFQAIRRNPSAIGKFKFLGTETWGNNLDILSGVEDLAIDAVTWSLESTDIGDFDTYLSTKSPGNYPQNPWFPAFYEEMVDCYLTVPDGRHPVQCASLSEVVISQRNYIQDPGILHVINAVYAAAIGIDSALKRVCGEDYSTVCEKFRNEANRRDILMENILKANFSDPTGSEFTFTDKRDGNKGYQMYSLSTRMEGDKLAYYYKKVGTFSNSKKLTLKNYKPSWDGSCGRPESCTECPGFITTKSRFMLQRSSQTNPATIVAFFPVSLKGFDAYKCGNLYLGSFYRALATSYTLKNLAPRPFNIRSLVLDTCSNTLRIDRDLYSILSSGGLCNSKTTFDSVINNSTIGGVITTSTANVIAANRILAPLKIPLVGAFSTSSVLNDKYTYPYVARTISSDFQETQAIADVLQYNNWTYVTVIYSKEVYGKSGYENFKSQAGKNGICITVSLPVPVQGSSDDIKNALSQLSTETGANVVILIAMNPEQILKAAKELGIINQYLWIGTETWGTNTLDSNLVDDVKGSITVAMRNTMVTGFNNYLKTLRYNYRDNIPDDWFEEFYQQVHQCQLPRASVVYSQYKVCDLSEQITDEKLQMNHYIIYTTIAATYSIANAIQSTKDTRCATKTNFKDCFYDNSNKEYLFKRLLETKWSGWTDEPGFDLNFNEDRYWDVGYDIYNYVVENGLHMYKKVGSTTGENTGSFSPILTYKPGSFMSQCPVENDCKCMDIVTKQPSAVQQTSIVEKNAEGPRNYYWYKYIQLEKTAKHYTWPIWAIAVCVPTCVGLFIGLFIFCFFLCAYPVRGGTTVLGFMMIFGILCIYAVNFAFFLKASNLTCGIRRFLMGVVYAIVYAALLVKSVDNWRFINIEYSVRKYSGLTSASSLFAIAIGLVCVQIIIPVEWLILVHPTASLLSETELHDWWWCDPVDKYDYSLALSMLFVMFLVLLTAIFSGMAWDSKSNYYESRWICVGCISTAGCFLVWMIVSTNAGPEYRDPAVALGNLFNATALLICLPIRKLLLLCKFKRADEKENEIEDDTYAHMDQGTELYSTVYHNDGFQDMFEPMEGKPHAENGF
ncbi:uncharacterized protein LOC127711239 isoform X2 [Mytilus californianus]|uniref:uncharacterized protein LOC127711239 isoform X2 n=1 Tax=Mytilus californianus TaxID=6549 RepID=UPI002247F0DC|nr:uncharacterized protein LOC127711239 isoform X2 [Mytilus californianus]